MRRSCSRRSTLSSTRAIFLLTVVAVSRRLRQLFQRLRSPKAKGKC